MTSAITSSCQAFESSGETGAGWAMILGTSQISAATSGIIKLTATLNPQVPIPNPTPHGGLSGSTGLSFESAHSSLCGSEAIRGSVKQLAQTPLYRDGSKGAPQMRQPDSGSESTPIEHLSVNRDLTAASDSSLASGLWRGQGVGGAARRIGAARSSMIMLFASSISPLATLANASSSER